MATLAEVRTRIAEVLQDTGFTSISSASVDAVINDSINFYKRDRFWFNEAAASLTCTTGSRFLSGIPSDFLRELEYNGLTVFYGNIYYPLKKMSSEEYDGGNISALGLPLYYCYRNGAFELYMYPNVDYPITLRYLKDYDALSGDSATNDWLTYADRMIRLDALSRIYIEYKQDEKMASFYANGASEERRMLLKQSNIKVGSGHLTSDSVLTI